MFSNTTARPRCFIRLGDAADGLSTAPVGLRLPVNTAIPPLADIERTPYLTNSTILDLDTLPEHLVIYGGSYVALEFGQMYRRFGSRVTIVERGPHLLSREDNDISDRVPQILQAEEIEVPVERKGDAPSGAAAFCATSASG